MYNGHGAWPTRTHVATALMGRLTLMSDAFIQMTWWCSSPYSFFASSKLYWASCFCRVAGSKKARLEAKQWHWTFAALLHGQQCQAGKTAHLFMAPVNSSRPVEGLHAKDCTSGVMCYVLRWWLLRCGSAA